VDSLAQDPFFEFCPLPTF